MNSRGLVELVILSIGLQRHVITPALFSIMVIVAIATTMLAGPVIALAYPEAASWRTTRANAPDAGAAPAAPCLARGLAAERPAMPPASRFAAAIRVEKDGASADARSLLSVLQLDVRRGDVRRGDVVTLVADGSDADEAVCALAGVLTGP
jgi:phosphotransferase system HPr-like phosphotransfer protein